MSVGAIFAFLNGANNKRFLEYPTHSEHPIYTCGLWIAEVYECIYICHVYSTQHWNEKEFIFKKDEG